MDKPAERVVLRDVASHAGVSLGTASNALAGHPRVAPATRELVLTAVRDLGYRPRPRRPRAAPADVGLLGFVTRKRSSLVTDPFYSHILHGAEAACANVGLNLIHEMVPAGPAGLDDLPLMVQRKRADGVLVAGYVDRALVATIQRSRVPFVFAEYYVEPAVADSVCIDDAEGGYLATRYLLDRGHRAPPPAIIAGPPTHTSFRDRLRGYRRALAEADVVQDEAYVRVSEVDTADREADVHALLDLPVPPTAIFCSSDRMAMHALTVLRARNVAVPEACSVVGFDDIAWAPHAVPALTTIRVDKELLGAQAIRHLLERIEFPGMALRQTRIAVELIERASVRTKRAST